MAVDALVPDDPRVERKFTTIGDLTYHYMLAKPKVTPVATVVLCHGWYVHSPPSAWLSQFTSRSLTESFTTGQTLVWDGVIRSLIFYL